MSYTDEVQRTVDDLEKLENLAKVIRERQEQCDKIEDIYKSPRAMYRNIDREIGAYKRSITESFRYYMIRKITPGLSSTSRAMVKTILPKDTESTLKGHIQSDRQEAFTELVSQIREMVGPDPAEVGDKLVLVPIGKYYCGDKKDPIDTVGRFMDVMIHKSNPVTAKNTLLDYLVKDSADYGEHINPNCSVEVWKTKYFKNRKLKIWMFSHHRLEFMGKLIRGELTGQDFILKDHTVLKCP